MASSGDDDEEIGEDEMEGRDVGDRSDVSWERSRSPLIPYMLMELSWHMTILPVTSLMDVQVTEPETGREGGVILRTNSQRLRSQSINSPQDEADSKALNDLDMDKLVTGLW